MSPENRNIGDRKFIKKERTDNSMSLVAMIQRIIKENTALKLVIAEKRIEASSENISAEEAEKLRKEKEKSEKLKEENKEITGKLRKSQKEVAKLSMKISYLEDELEEAQENSLVKKKEQKINSLENELATWKKKYSEVVGSSVANNNNQVIWVLGSREIKYKDSYWLAYNTVVDEKSASANWTRIRIANKGNLNSGQSDPPGKSDLYIALLPHCFNKFMQESHELRSIRFAKKDFYDLYMQL